MLHALARDRSTRQVRAPRRPRRHRTPLRQGKPRPDRGLPTQSRPSDDSRPTDTDRQGVDYLEASRLSAEPVRRLGLLTDADAYLCGPVAFMTASPPPSWMTVSTLPASTPRSSARDPPSPPGSRARRPRPRPTHPRTTRHRTRGLLRPQRLHRPLERRAGVLAGLAEADVPVQWLLHRRPATPAVALMSGAVDYSPIVEPPAEGNILNRRSKPAGGVVVDLKRAADSRRITLYVLVGSRQAGVISSVMRSAAPTPQRARQAPGKRPTSARERRLATGVALYASPPTRTQHPLCGAGRHFWSVAPGRAPGNALPP